MSQSYQHSGGGAAVACPSSEQLVAFATGAADDDTSASIALHIAACPLCEQFVQSVDSSDDPLTTRVRLALLGGAERDESECFRMMQAAVELGTRGRQLVPDDHEQEATHSVVGTPEIVSDATRFGSLPTTTWKPLAIGETISRYRIESLLGEGTYGRVYLAHDPQLDRPVALKVAKLSELGDAMLLSAFQAEARSAARLRHPGIVTIYEVGCAGEYHYIAMEFVPGQSLRELLVGKPQPAELVADLVSQAAQAMHYAHKQGLMHRDLKPANMLLDSDGRVRIADFGLALHEDQQRKRAGDRAGTLAYMPPEQVRGDSHRIDGRADIWSLGVIMYELLAGRRPFQGGHRELEDEILNRSPKPLRQIRDDVDSDLEQICLKCLAKTPEQRFSSAKDLADALRHWQPQFVSPGPAAKHGRQRRPIVSVSIKILIYAGCLLLLLLPAAWFVTTRIPMMGQPASQPPIWPYRVDKFSKENSWLWLLEKQKPETTFFEIARTQFWHHDPDQQQVLMHSPTLTLLGLGTTRNNAYTIHVALTKDPASGYAGIFLGLEPLLGEVGPARKGQLIVVRCDDQEPVAVCRIRLKLIERGGGLTSISTYEMTRVTLTPERLGQAPKDTTGAKYAKRAAPLPELIKESPLVVEVARGKIDKVHWQGHLLPELADPQFDDNGNVPGCVGRFGLVNYLGSTIFSDARFMPLARPSP